MARPFQILLCLCLAFFASAQAPCPSATTTATLTWTVRAATRTSGATVSRWLTVNNEWPAAPIVYDRCTRLDMTVENKLVDDDVTLHFHGLLQNDGQTMMDGVQGLSQSGIQPTKSFTYRLNLDKEGTYWVHSHSAGQYPQGLRAPLIVQPNNGDINQAAGQIKSDADAVIRLSDWWPNFKEAEEKSKNGVCGVGIEVPPKRVTFNDVWGYNPPTDAAGVAKAKADRTISVSCGTTKRIRLINMSSHARFYIAFSDEREFEVNELDGVLYQRTRTSLLELASGQRASILVNGLANTKNNQCKSAYILALSDPRIGAGNDNGSDDCRLARTRPNWKVQYTHGYLEVNSGGTTQTLAEPPAGADSAEPKLIPGPEPTGHFPAGYATNNDNRLSLDYKRLCFTATGANSVYTYNYTSTTPRCATMGTWHAEELAMKPSIPIPAWTLEFVSNKASHMHYIALGEHDGGVPGMTENWNADSNPQRKWSSPDEGASASNLRWPSLYRALTDSFDDATILSATTYQNGDNQKGRTIMVTDDQPHWFIIRSTVGDHPLHMHGHHFQVLAKLADPWWFENFQTLYDNVVAGGTNATAYLPNPARRDTIMIEKYFTYVIAIKPDNPGVWAFHCHNDIHAAEGMFSQIIERPVELRKMLGSWGLVAGNNGKQEMRWWYSDNTVGNWRTKTDIGNWMVDSFNAAIDKYNLGGGFYANNPNLPSKWGRSGTKKRWLPRGSRWY